MYSSKPLDFVKRILVGAGACSPSLHAACQLRFPAASIFTAYGMTEACSSITFQALNLQSRSAEGVHGPKGACVGRPPLGIEICIHGRADAGAIRTLYSIPGAFARFMHTSELYRCLLGEIWTRGPNTLLRYWGLSEAKEPGGWFRTGDLGEFISSYFTVLATWRMLLSHYLLLMCLQVPSILTVVYG